MKQPLFALYETDPRKACKLALRRTSDINNPDDRMDAIDKLLGFCGVEGIRGNWSNGYWCDIVATYCNTGETYSQTVICERTGSDKFDCRFYVADIGWFIETKSDKLGIQ